MPYGYFQVFLEKPVFPFFHVNQNHSINLVGPSEKIHNADGIIISKEEILKPLAIKTADCLPVILLGKKDVAFIHAGWRGLHQKIFKQDKLKKIKPYFAFIGPHICCDHFEVQKDFLRYFSKKNFLEKKSQIFFNLTSEAKDQIKWLNPNIKIHLSSLCTWKDSQLHSYRRDQTNQRN